MKVLGPVDDSEDITPRSSLDTKAPIASPTFTGTVSGVTKSMVGLGNVDNTSDANKPVSTAQQTALNAKANLSGATFTGAVDLGWRDLRKVNIAPYLEELVSLPSGAGTKTMDLSVGNAFFLDATSGAITLEFANLPVAEDGGEYIHSVTLCVYDPLSITWPANTQFGSAGVPTLNENLHNWFALWKRSSSVIWFASAIYTD